MFSSILQYLVGQSAHPKGFIGRVMTILWKRYFIEQTGWTCSLLNDDTNSSEKILVVGYGGGYAIRYLADSRPGCTVYGIDISKKALETASRDNEDLIQGRRARLSTGNVASMPYDSDMFDAVLCIQTHMYWDDLEGGLSECLRVLKHGGQLLITSEADKIDYHLPRYSKHEDFIKLLSDQAYQSPSLLQKGVLFAFTATK